MDRSRNTGGEFHPHFIEGSRAMTKSWIVTAVAGLTALVLGMAWAQTAAENRKLVGKIASLEAAQGEAEARHSANLSGLQVQISKQGQTIEQCRAALDSCQEAPLPVSKPALATAPAVDYNQVLLHELSMFCDALQVANRAPRIAASIELEKLQKIRRETAGISWPTAILQRAQFAIQGEDAAIRAFLIVVDGGDQSALDREIQVSKQYFIDARRQ
jgi:hypothetical protein